MKPAKSDHKPVHRTDLHQSNLTARKRDKVIDLVCAFRRCAPLLGREQWRLFFEAGRFNKTHDVDKISFARVIGTAARVQMCRFHVVGQLTSFISNRANDFGDAVTRSSLDDRARHMLRIVNKAQAWFDLKRQLRMPKTGEVIPADMRRLARAIMRNVLSRHRKPNLSRVSMFVDQREASLERPRDEIRGGATQNGRIGYWLGVRALDGEWIEIPLLIYSHHENRPGVVANSIQVNLDRDENLSFGVVKDMGEACAKSRAAYKPKLEAIALDFGLSTLFATSDGRLLGQDWLKRLRQYDHLLTMIAAAQQRAGKKPRDSKRYRDLIKRVRGFIETEVNRVFNDLVAKTMPAALVLERLDFRNPELSRRLNRIIQNCGRSVIQAKLADLEQRLGIVAAEVNPAYTSQTCSHPDCGYVDKRNRPKGSKIFCCLYCGRTKHADLNAAPNIGQRRATDLGSVYLRKAAVLGRLAADFMARHPTSERQPGRSPPWRNGRFLGPPADPRWTNPYFAGLVRPEEVISPVVRRAKSERLKRLDLALAAG
jgi:putative transposase